MPLTAEGILIAVNKEEEFETFFQVIGVVSNMDEAREMIDGYMRHGSIDNLLCPSYFEIHGRGEGGWYTRIERIELEAS